MTKSEAHRILDTARAGANVPEARITAALGATGDLATFLRSRMANPAERQQAARVAPPSPKIDEFMEQARPLFERKTGATMAELHALVGGERARIQAYLTRARIAGRLFLFGENRHTVYFLTLDAREEGAPLLLAAAAAARAAAQERKNEQRRKPKSERWIAERKAYDAKRYVAVLKPARAAKPPKEPKPIKFAQPKPIPAKSSLDAWKRSEAVNPNDIKPQVIPGFTGDRWQVQPSKFGFASMGVGRYFA